MCTSGTLQGCLDAALPASEQVVHVQPCTVGLVSVLEAQKKRLSPVQAWAWQCERLAAAGWAAGASGLRGPLQQPAAFEALYRPLLAAWAAVPALGLATQPSAGSSTPSAERDVAEGKQDAAAAGVAASALSALQRGTAALAGLLVVQPQLGNLLVRKQSESCLARFAFNGK